ncbi:MAG: phosphatidylglycerophosphatase A [Candidatus Izemoplasmataceae bacterium]|uniref:phosphatidylglycerophosphatase A family protein n=1 Tax=Liberiplasma polymorphum TaxID=3374570 RepID=UPI00377509FE
MTDKKKYAENRLNDTEKHDIVVKMLNERGVTLEEIAELTYDLQISYVPSLTMETCLDHVERVVFKREVQNAILTGLELDILAEKGLISEPLSSMLMNDYGLYGIDEVLALAIVNVYGSIGFTNFGYVDKLKPGVIKKLDDIGKQEGKCNTFLDDIVGAIAAAAASSIAHRYA